MLAEIQDILLREFDNEENSDEIKLIESTEWVTKLLNDQEINDLSEKDEWN